MIYNNPQISKRWRDLWSKKEEYLSICYLKSLENLSEQIKSSQPLNCSDHVMIQSQTDNFPKKQGKSGVIVELK